MTGTSERNKQVVRRLFDAVRAGDVAALDDLVVENYVQHNPLVGDGREAMKTLLGQFGPVDVEVHRTIAEGDLVAVHAHYRSLGMAGVDIFRLDADGRIVEHWDVVQPVPSTTASGNDMFSELT